MLWKYEKPKIYKDLFNKSHILISIKLNTLVLFLLFIQGIEYMEFLIQTFSKNLRRGLLLFVNYKDLAE